MPIQVKIYDDKGGNGQALSQASINYLSMTVAENEIGELVVKCPLALVNWSWVSQTDRIITVERDAGAGYYVECGKGAERGFFLRDVECSTENNLDYCTLYAYDGNYIWDGRIVNAPAESGTAKKTDEADDMLIILARESAGTAAGTGRYLEGLTIGESPNKCGTIEKSMSYSNVLQTMKGICETAWNDGKYLVFDTIYQHPGNFTYQVYVNQRGVNQSSTGSRRAIVQVDNGKVRLARKDERNYIYVNGQGAKAARQTQEVSNASWIAESRWNRREAAVNASHTSGTASLQTEGKQALYHNRPRWTLQGEIKDIDGQRYGINYHWGDMVIAQYKGISFDCHVTAVSITLQDGKETVSVTVRGEK